MGIRMSRSRCRDSGFMIFMTFMTERVGKRSYEGAEGGQIGRTSEGTSQNVVFLMCLFVRNCTWQRVNDAGTIEETIGGLVYLGQEVGRGKSEKLYNIHNIDCTMSVKSDGRVQMKSPPFAFSFVTPWSG